MAGAAQIQTRFGSLIAGVRISPRAEDRAVVKRNSDLGRTLDSVTILDKDYDLRDKSFHAGRGSCVRKLIRCDIAETLAESSQGDVRDLPPDADVGNGVAGGRMLPTRRELIDLPLDQGTEDTGQGSDRETESDARDAAELDVVSAQERVDDVGQQRNSEDDGQGVEVAE